MWLGDAAQGTPAGTSPAQSDWAAITQTLAPLIQTGLQVWNMQDLLNFNKQLIAQGKTPLTAAEIQSLTAGAQPVFNVGLSQSTQTIVQDALIGAGVLIGGYFIIRAIQRSR